MCFLLPSDVWQPEFLAQQAQANILQARQGTNGKRNRDWPAHCHTTTSYQSRQHRRSGQGQQGSGVINLQSQGGYRDLFFACGNVDAVVRIRWCSQGGL